MEKRNAEEKRESEEEGKLQETENLNEYSIYPYQLQSSEMLDVKRKEIEKEFFNLLKVINEEAQQLSEFLMEENKLTHELCTLLKQILTRLNISLTIPKEAVPLLEKTREIILNAQGHLIIVNDEGKANSKALEEFCPDIILMVVWNVIPELKNSISLYRKKVSLRVNFFDKISQELKNIQRAFIGEPSLEEHFQEDGIKKALLSRK